MEAIRQFSHSVVSDSLRPHGLQYARLPCPSPTPGAYSNSSPWSRWCHPTISSLCCPLFLLSLIFPSIRVFCWLCSCDLRPNYGGDNEDDGDHLQKIPCWQWCSQCPQPCSRPLPQTPGHSWAGLGQSLVESLLLSPASSAHKVLFVASKCLFP